MMTFLDGEHNGKQWQALSCCGDVVGDEGVGLPGFNSPCRLDDSILKLILKPTHLIF